MTYQLSRGRFGWKRKEEGYTLPEIEQKAISLGLKLRDGYGRSDRSRLRRARKLVLSNGVEFRAVTVERPTRSFGAKTPTEPAE